MFRSIVREAAEKMGTLEELMSGMDPTSGCEMRLLTQMKDGRFAFFAIPERMNGLRDYETQGSSTRGSKEQIMAEISPIGNLPRNRRTKWNADLSLLFSSVLTAPPGLHLGNRRLGLRFPVKAGIAVIPDGGPICLKAVLSTGF